MSELLDIAVGAREVIRAGVRRKGIPKMTAKIPLPAQQFLATRVNATLGRHHRASN